MDEKCYNVRLYVTHDLDLVSLYLKGYHLSLAIREAVTALCEGRVFRYRIKDQADAKRNDRKIISLRVRFDREEDEDVISLLERLPNKNLFLKNVLRLYLLRPFESLETDMDDNTFFESKFQAFKRPEEIDLPRKTNRRVIRRRKQETKTVKPAPSEGDLTDMFLTML